MKKLGNGKEDFRQKFNKIMFFKKQQKNEMDNILVKRGVKRRESVWITCILIFLFLLFLSFWFVFFSGYFSIEEYQINTLNVLEKDIVIGEVGKYLDGTNGLIRDRRNIFLIDEHDIENYLMNTFFVESVTVDKIYPNILRLNIKERQRSVILVSKNKIYIVDDYGFIIDLADQAMISSTREFLSSTTPVDSLKEIFIITPTSTNFEIGSRYSSTEVVRGWLDLAEKLRNSGIWFKAIQINDNEPDILHIILKENKDVILDEGISLEAQIDTLRQFIQTKPDWNNIHEYVDVRIPGRIYYK